MVFFECRLDQLSSQLDRANAEIERLKADLSQAAQREVALKQELATADSRTAQARRERDEAFKRVEAAGREREGLLDKLIEGERIRLAGEEVEGIDLAAFIADLRAEVLTLRGEAPRRDASRAGFASAEQAATALADAGRIGITEADRETLKAAARFETRSEETLFALSLRELSAADPVARSRAAQRLQSLSARAALPAVAAALNAEQVPEVLCALLQVCGAAGEGSVLPIVQARLSHDSVEVRLAALEACVHLKDSPALTQAMDDDASRVRRRAAILASALPDAAAVLERAARDADPSVRRVAALGLASRGGESAVVVLLAALDDPDQSVRRAAAKGLSSALGPEVFAVADLDQARRHREIRRLAGQPRVEQPPPPQIRASEPVEVASADNQALETEVLTRVRSALRGQSEEELFRDISAKPQEVREAAAALVGQGRLIRRGQRLFVP